MCALVSRHDSNLCLSRPLTWEPGLVAMEGILVRRDQFVISPQGILHKPTDAAFTPDPGNPYSGMSRLGQLSSQADFRRPAAVALHRRARAHPDSAKGIW
jgi:hypothetical protein